VQAVEPDVERHLDPAQNHRLDVIERILRRAIPTVMPPVYNAPSRPPSSLARVARACGRPSR
jgi:hypothetical protein